MPHRMYNVASEDSQVADVRQVHWRTRQVRSLLYFELDAEGLPVNPREPGLPEGQGGLKHWGEAVAVDAMVFHVDIYETVRLLMIERGDGHGWALPGGKLDAGETPKNAVARELREETGLDLAESRFYMHDARYVPDPRATRRAWMVTIPGQAVMRGHNPPSVAGADDARRAEWIPAASYAEVEAVLAGMGGKVFAAHRDLLRHQLG